MKILVTGNRIYRKPYGSGTLKPESLAVADICQIHPRSRLTDRTTENPSFIS